MLRREYTLSLSFALSLHQSLPFRLMTTPPVLVRLYYTPSPQLFLIISTFFQQLKVPVGEGVDGGGRALALHTIGIGTASPGESGTQGAFHPPAAGEHYPEQVGGFFHESVGRRR